MSIINPMNDCILIQGILKTSVTIPAGNIEAVVSSGSDISNIFSALSLGYIPTDRKLVGAVFLWANGSTLAAADTLIQNGKLTLRLYNFASTSVNVTSIRLLTFWE